MRELDNIAKEIRDICINLECHEASNLADSVLNSINSNRFYLAVLGEFKRGKSTLINSLLGENLLPSDVLPSTAVITIIDYSEEEKCIIHWLDEDKEGMVIKKEELCRLSVGGDIDASFVKYVEVKIKNDLLKDGISIIDTPGVNDISKARIEVTNNILPYCDAAMFLLDAVAPVTKSEGDFLVTKVLNNKLDTLIFIISKADRLDEEELEESVDGARSRLVEVLKRDFDISTYSSKDVLKANQENRIDPHKTELISKIYDLKVISENSKIHRNIDRLLLAVDIAGESLNLWRAFSQAHQEDVNRFKDKLQNEKLGYDIQIEHLIMSINKVGRETLIQMFEKSLDEYKKKLADDFMYQIRLQEGNVEKLFKQVIPIQIEKALKHFSEIKSLEIKNYLTRFSKHMVMEYEENFKIPLMLKLSEHSIKLLEWTSDQNSYVTENAANKILKGSLPYLAGAVVTSVLLPHLAVAALIGGTLSGTISSINTLHNNEKLKEQYLAKLPAVLDEVFDGYRNNAISLINFKFDELINVVKKHHNEQLSNINQRIQLKLGNGNSNEQVFLDTDINATRDRMDQLRLELSRG